MAETYISNTSDILEFDEFIAIIKQKLNSEKDDAILDCTDALFKMANNKAFFLDFLNKTLSSLGGRHDFQKDTRYTEQSIVLKVDDGFMVRMTYWPTYSSNSIIKKSQHDSFSYGLVHDHNFHLLTAGYLGNGYSTKLWEYDYDSVIGFVGEKVNTTFLEKTTLCENKILFYRGNKDIHCQFPPINENSLALNIIPTQKRSSSNFQYQFNDDATYIKSRIIGSLESPYHLLFDLSEKFNNSETSSQLQRIAVKGKTPILRRRALGTLYKIEKNRDVWKLGMTDSSNNIRNYCAHLYDLGDSLPYHKFT